MQNLDQESEITIRKNAVCLQVCNYKCLLFLRAWLVSGASNPPTLVCSPIIDFYSYSSCLIMITKFYVMLSYMYIYSCKKSRGNPRISALIGQNVFWSSSKSQQKMRSLLKLISHKNHMFSCFYWRQHVNIHRTGWQKVVEPSDLITGRPSLGNNNLNQTFPVVADQTCTTGRRNFGAFLFTKLFQFSKILGVSRVNCSLNVMPQNLNGLRSGLWLGHSKTQIIFLLKPFCCWFTSCFGSLSCCIIHPQLNFTWWWDELKFPYKISL